MCILGSCKKEKIVAHCEVYTWQGCQYRTGGRTGLATDTIYFGYQSIPVYRFGFTAILYIYVCMYVSVYIYIYIL